jgi:protein ImuA
MDGDRLAALRAEIALVGGTTGTAPLKAGVMTGLAALDARLPAGGLQAGGIHAVTGSAAHGFVTFLLARRGGAILWCRRPGTLDGLYPPGLFDHGIDPAKVILAEARDQAELLETAEEGLRCASLAAVVAEPPKALDLTASRRLQLAAQAGGVLGLLILPSGSRSEAARSEAGRVSLLTAWEAEPAATTLTRCRGGRPGSWTVQWNGQTHRLHLAAAAGDGPAVAAQGRRLAV